jgi:hypothetical protein
MHPAEKFLQEISDIRRSGAGTKETSCYGPLAALLDEAGSALRPRVRCIVQLQNRGAGSPDLGLFVADQFQKTGDTEPLRGQKPARGVVEVKSPAEDITQTIRSPQVARYLSAYGSVLVTNLREFALVGQGFAGKPEVLETFSLAPGETAFWEAAAHPQKTAKEVGERLLDYLRRVLLHNAPLVIPADVAWFLASYAREALARVETAGDLPALAAVRTALEDALGARFEGARGEHFFRSTLVQTLFYGVFSAWVLWSREHPPTDRAARFDWRSAAWSLRVAMIRALFEDLAKPSKLAPLGLVEVLDWTAAALSRVDRAAFFENFHDEHAVQYFYEPFLEAFDPELRKELGVWYTPPEIVRYMVARVDAALREELDIPDGLADPRVVVLDPCCGTGAYLVETLRCIGETLRRKGGDALVASDLRRAARERVFGFELLPAPFVVSHLQIGLLLQNLGAPLSDKKSERVGVFLTNALTGWESPKTDGQSEVAKALDLFPEMLAERDAANAVKQDQPILVILGNPPYNGFAGMAVAEERDLSGAYRSTKKAPPPQGQGLNDLYVRFFRMAERKIVEGTRQGIVCFISNYSWLDGLSHTGMRERYLEVFDRIWVDCLNGDKYKTGKLTPEGEPDPSIFSTDLNREGIQVGTVITLLLRREKHKKTAFVRFRYLWGKAKRQQLAKDAEKPRKVLYEAVKPPLELGFPFLPAKTTPGYFSWPLLPELFSTFFPGVKTSRDELVVDIDRDRLEKRMRAYFNPKISHEEMRRICSCAVEKSGSFDAQTVREHLCRRGFLPEMLVKYCYRPLDIWWLYWEPETNLLDRKREDYRPQVLIYGNAALVSQQKPRREWSPPQMIRHLGCLDLMDRGATCFPLFIQHGCEETIFSVHEGCNPVPNLSPAAENYRAKQSAGPKALFEHALAILHSPEYSAENAGALRQDWPRIPLPESGKKLAESAVLGRQVAALLDPEADVHGVTAGDVRPELRELGVFSLIPGHDLDEESDLALTAGWGHGGKGGVTMPGRGKITEREYSLDERDAISAGAKALGLSAKQVLSLLGEGTCDVWLGEHSFWRNIPLRVWDYSLGGYPVVKKWLSYREQMLLGRPLHAEEVRHVTAMVRRIAALLLLSPALDKNYQGVKTNAGTREA